MPFRFSSEPVTTRVSTCGASAQIAARCGISASAVEKNIARACLLLGTAIEREESWSVVISVVDATTSVLQHLQTV
jgi:hypothetical protein